MILRLQCRNTGRRRRRRGAQQTLQNPLAALHHRSPVGVRGDRENAALPQQSAAVRVGERHAAELRAVDIGDAVVLRQALVEKSVVGVQQVQHAAVLAQHAGKEQVRFLEERPAQGFIEFGEYIRIGPGEGQVAQIQPLAGEVLDQRLGTWIGQHPLHLVVNRGGSVQTTLFGQSEQLIVGNAAPQEK